ncbi:MAG: PEP-CTERM sorting domain-containing protein [candidate division Zixibacteria bacterium]|nr:PEP-CTERM sorting domain-containing protein [candidate division Zixibacteria bacterium]
MKKIVLTLFVVMFLCGTANAQWFMDFEWGLGHDQEVIGSTIDGVSFTTVNGYDWIYGDATTGNWNVDNQYGDFGGGYHMRDNVFAFCGIDANAGAGRVDFDNQDGSWFTTGYCANSDFYLEAYDADDNLIDQAAGGNNYNQSFDYLSVSSSENNIAYVLMHDTGNYWLVDDMSGDATGVDPPNDDPIPEPTTILLLASGLLGLGGISRFRRK